MMNMGIVERSVTEQGAEFDRMAAKARQHDVVVEQYATIFSMIEHPCGCVDERVTRRREIEGRVMYATIMERTNPCECHVGFYADGRA